MNVSVLYVIIIIVEAANKARKWQIVATYFKKQRNFHVKTCRVEFSSRGEYGWTWSLDGNQNHFRLNNSRG